MRPSACPGGARTLACARPAVVVLRPKLLGLALDAQTQLCQTRRDLSQARYNVLLRQLKLRQAIARCSRKAGATEHAAPALAFLRARRFGGGPRFAHEPAAAGTQHHAPHAVGTGLPCDEAGLLQGQQLQQQR